MHAPPTSIARLGIACRDPSTVQRHLRQPTAATKSLQHAPRFPAPSPQIPDPELQHKLGLTLEGKLDESQIPNLEDIVPPLRVRTRIG